MDYYPSPSIAKLFVFCSWTWTNKNNRQALQTMFTWNQYAIGLIATVLLGTYKCITQCGITVFCFSLFHSPVAVALRSIDWWVGSEGQKFTDWLSGRNSVSLHVFRREWTTYFNFNLSFPNRGRTSTRTTFDDGLCQLPSNAGEEGRKEMDRELRAHVGYCCCCC